jgi:hypothetical protein
MNRRGCLLGLALCCLSAACVIALLMWSLM